MVCFSQSRLKTMHQFVETGVDNGFMDRSGQTIIVHTSEAGRSDSLMEDIDDCFCSDDVHRLGSERLGKAQNWSDDSRDAQLEMEDITPCKHDRANESKRTSVSDENEALTPEMAKAVESIETFRLLHRPKHEHGKFLLDNVPIKLSSSGPANYQRKPDLDLSSARFLTERFKYKRPISREDLDSKNKTIKTKFQPARVKPPAVVLELPEENEGIELVLWSILFT